MNKQPSELDNAVDSLISTLINGPWGLTPYPIQQAARFVVDHLKEVQKERDELRQQIVPGFFGRMAAKKSIELKLLRADYIKALAALKTLRGTARHAHDCYEMKSGEVVRKERCCDHCEVQIINSILSTPAAIAMKGEV